MRDPLQHDWHLVSRHRTSDGEVRYERCRCGTDRIVAITAGRHLISRTPDHQRFPDARRPQQGCSGD